MTEYKNDIKFNTTTSGTSSSDITIDFGTTTGTTSNGFIITTSPSTSPGIIYNGPWNGNYVWPMTAKEQLAISIKNAIRNEKLSKKELMEMFDEALVDDIIEE